MGVENKGDREKGTCKVVGRLRNRKKINFHLVIATPENCPSGETGAVKGGMGTSSKLYGMILRFYLVSPISFTS